MYVLVSQSNHYSMNYTNKFFSLVAVLTIMFGFSTISSAQCVYATQLSGEEFEMGNMLTWSTASEINNKAFIVEKSVDGKDFSTIGRVKGAGTTLDGKRYRFLDVSASKGKAFYRLRQVNSDNSASYSRIINLDKEGGNNFTVISMTPPTDKDATFEVTINAISEDDMDYKIYDMQGNLVYRQKQKLKKGINIISVDINEISESSTMGFAGNNELLGDKVGYRVALEGQYEAEMLTIAPRNRDVLKEKKEKKDKKD